MLLLSRMLRPLSVTANDVESAVQRAIQAIFAPASRVAPTTKSVRSRKISIAFWRFPWQPYAMGNDVAQLIKHAPPTGYNLFTTTVEMVDGLIKAAHFKQAIEEDETRMEIYQRLADLIRNDFSISTFSIYEVASKDHQMTPVIVDGEVNGACRWCSPKSSCARIPAAHGVPVTSSTRWRRRALLFLPPPAELSGMSHFSYPSSSRARSAAYCNRWRQRGEGITAALPAFHQHLPARNRTGPRGQAPHGHAARVEPARCDDRAAQPALT